MTVGNGGVVFLVGGAVVADSSFHGVIAFPGASVELLDSTVRNSGNIGAYAFGGSIRVSGNASLIESSTFSGLTADDGGSASLAGGARSARNGAGLSATGGALLIQDGAIVEDNLGSGVILSTASALRVHGGVIIRRNGSHGVQASDTSVASFDNTTQIVDNGGFGIFCNGPPSVALFNGDPTVTGNASGQVNCPHV